MEEGKTAENRQDNYTDSTIRMLGFTVCPLATSCTEGLRVTRDHSDLPSVVHGRDVPDGHHRWHPDAGSVWLGLRETIRKLYYNMNITLISVLVALVVGSIEALG